jgi:hypothetical protein
MCCYWRLEFTNDESEGFYLKEKELCAVARTIPRGTVWLGAGML